MADSTGANGALIEVAESELEHLDEREIRYDRLEVTGSAIGDHAFETIFTYVAKPQHFCPEAPQAP